MVTPETGLTAFLTNVLTPIFAGKAPILFIILILGVAMLLTNFANNVVVGMLMLPVVFSLAGQLSLDSAGIAVLFDLLLPYGYFDTGSLSLCRGHARQQGVGGYEGYLSLRYG